MKPLASSHKRVGVHWWLQELRGEEPHLSLLLLFELLSLCVYGSVGDRVGSVEERCFDQLWT
jgi:hypothetical protein